MGFSRQEYWSGLPFPSPGDLPLPDPGIEPRSPTLQVDALLTFTPPGKPLSYLIFRPVILIPACASSSPVFLMMYSAYKLNHTWRYLSNKNFIWYFDISYKGWGALPFPGDAVKECLTCLRWLNWHQSHDRENLNDIRLWPCDTNKPEKMKVVN